MVDSYTAARPGAHARDRRTGRRRPSASPRPTRSTRAASASWQHTALSSPAATAASATSSPPAPGRRPTTAPCRARRPLPADLVLIAIGFSGPEPRPGRATAPAPQRPRHDRRPGLRDAALRGVYAAGDARRGQSLVVWAITEGRRCARRRPRPHPLHAGTARAESATDPRRRARPAVTPRPKRDPTRRELARRSSTTSKPSITASAPLDARDARALGVREQHAPARQCQLRRFAAKKIRRIR